MLTVILSQSEIFENIDRESFLRIKNRFFEKHKLEFEKFLKENNRRER